MKNRLTQAKNALVERAPWILLGAGVTAAALTAAHRSAQDTDRKIAAGLADADIIVMQGTGNDGVYLDLTDQGMVYQVKVL